MLESQALLARRHRGSVSQPRAPCRAAWAGWDPRTVLGLHPCSESELGDLSRAIFMKNKVMGNFHPKALWTLRVSSPTSDCGYQGCLCVGNQEVFPWKPAVSLGGTPRHRFGAFIGAAEAVLSLGRHQPGRGSRSSDALAPRHAAGRSLALPSVLHVGRRSKTWGQAMTIGAASPPAVPPPPPGAPASPSVLLPAPFSSFLFPIPFLSLSSPCSTPVQTPLWGIDFSIRQRNA